MQQIAPSWPVSDRILECRCRSHLMKDRSGLLGRALALHSQGTVEVQFKRFIVGAADETLFIVVEVKAVDPPSVASKCADAFTRERIPSAHDSIGVGLICIFIHTKKRAGEGTLSPCHRRSRRRRCCRGS